MTRGDETSDKGEGSATRGSRGDGPYYTAYDDRYRRVYAQGVEFWTACPEEVHETTETLDAFLKEVDRPDAVVLECGCGEGHLAMHLVARGYQYVGVDISPRAIGKARARMAACAGRVAPVFHVADCTGLACIEDGSIDVVVDNYHFHVLVTDKNRRDYLAAVQRVLRQDGWAYFRENLQAEGTLKSVASYEDYLAQTALDCTAEDDREAWQDGHAVNIKLPKVPSRANSREGYIAEFEAVGLSVQYSRACGSQCVLHARRSTRPVE